MDGRVSCDASKQTAPMFLICTIPQTACSTHPFPTQHNVQKQFTTQHSHLKPQHYNNTISSNVRGHRVSSRHDLLTSELSLWASAELVHLSVKNIVSNISYPHLHRPM
ncbi:hypothetical protein E3U43_012677 [Larimichthys crocea]|uniref:Uncharacterized protein n=1 Tax=Larimichthys crocea TaxID=215358 RepID=A0ACD3RSS9_LARCR|nr:hypothetical protein E3U43_012677 [Larimichthys crocea]